VEERNGSLRVVHQKVSPNNIDDEPEFLKGSQCAAMTIEQKARSQSHANFSWTKIGVVLKIRRDNTTTPSAKTPAVQLFCFGPNSGLIARFERLCRQASCSELLQDPYTLALPIFEEMYKTIDNAAWSLARVFGIIETVSHYSPLLLFRH
jgi:hypothetical protein